MADADDRTLAPSERRLQKAREDGDVPLSRELVSVAGLGGALIAAILAPSAAWDLMRQLRPMLENTVTQERALHASALAILGAVGPLAALAALAGTAAVLLQTGFLLHAKGAMPDLARLDPRRGLRRIFGIGSLSDLLKSVLKLCVLVWALRAAMTSAWHDLPLILMRDPASLATGIGQSLLHLLVLVVGLQAVIAILDLAWTRWRFAIRLRMSREDMRQESRESDGDPHVKGRLRQLRQRRMKRRMLAAVADATVVVTNPTHYAVALAYKPGSQSAPRIVAKGVDFMAARIRAAATDAGVPLVANPPLARALYTVPLDAEVPAEHFKVVAELIAYVFRLRGRMSGSN